MPIVDPGIKVERGYPAYQEGLKEGIFMRDWDGRPYLGLVWPGPCHFPDWLDARARSVFQGWMRTHHERVPYDGSWIDMGEVSNFCPGNQFCELKPGGGPPPPRSGLRDNFCELDCREPSGLNASQQALLHPPYDIASRLNRTPLGAFVSGHFLACMYPGISDAVRQIVLSRFQSNYNTPPAPAPDHECASEAPGRQCAVQHAQPLW